MSNLKAIPFSFEFDQIIIYDSKVTIPNNFFDVTEFNSINILVI